MVGTVPEALLGVAPRVADGVDLRSLSLTAPEGFLLSQIDGVTPAEVLCDLVAMDSDALVQHLRRLESLGVVIWASGAAAAAASGRPAHEAPGRRPATPSDAALDEACDLSLDEKKRILDAERALASQTHWELLGLSGDPSRADVKRAYFVASKAFHPDRYFGRSIGSYRARLERIFYAIKLAHDVLRDDAARAAYAASHPPPGAGQPAKQRQAVTASAAAPETPEQKRARLEKHRQEILAARRARRRDTHLKRHAADPSCGRKAEEMYAHGIVLLEHGDLFAAAASLKLAVTYVPENTKYHAVYQEANARAIAERARQLAEQAAVELATGTTSKAARSYAAAFEMAPGKSEYAVRAAQAYLDSGLAERAEQLAMQAVEISPNRLDARIVAALVLEARGDLRGALTHIEAAAMLDKKDGRVTKIAKRLRRAAG